MSSEIRLRVNTKDYEKKMARAKQSTEKLNASMKKSTGGLKGSFKSLGSSISANKLGILALAAAVTGFVGSTLAAASALETTTVKFEVLTGSVEKAKSHVEDLVNFTAKTPFQFEGVSQASAVLQSFGFSADDTMGKLGAIGDVASVTGSTIKELATIYGQVSAAGKLTGERLLQLQERGVPILDGLAKHYGKTTAEVQKLITAGGVSATTFRQVFDTLNDEGGFAFKGMEKQSQTLAGKWSTLKDNITILAQEIGKVFLPVAKKATDALTSLASGTTKAVKDTGGWIKHLTKQTVDFFKTEQEKRAQAQFETDQLIEQSQIDAAQRKKEREEQESKEKEEKRTAELEKELNQVTEYDLLKHEKLTENAQIEAEIDRAKKAAAIKRQLGHQKESEKLEAEAYKLQKGLDDKKKKSKLQTEAEAFSVLSQMQNSQYAALAAIGKAAALRKLWIDTKAGAASVFAGVSSFLSPFLGPAAIPVATGAKIAVYAYGAEQAAGIAGLQDGGTVLARAGSSPYRDSVPTNLAVGETVISRAVTDKIANMSDEKEPQQLIFNPTINVQGDIIADDEQRVSELVGRINDMVESQGLRLVASATEK